MDEKERIYQNYVSLRDERGLNDFQVSKRGDISNSTFVDWKKGRSSPKLDKLIKMARVLDVSLNELIGEDDGLRQRRKHKKRTGNHS